MNKSLWVSIMSQKSTTLCVERKKSFFADENFLWQWKSTIIQSCFPFVHGEEYFKQIQTLYNETESLNSLFNCLIEFSVAAKLKICFFRKKFDVSVLSEFYVREPMVFGSFYSPFSGFPLTFRLSLLTFLQIFQSVHGRKGFCSASTKVFPSVGSTSSNYWFSTSVKLSSTSSQGKLYKNLFELKAEAKYFI